MSETRKCAECSGYEPSGKPGFRCRMLKNWEGTSFEAIRGECNCSFWEKGAAYVVNDAQ